MKRENVLAGQVALVTGGSRGIGLAIAARLGEMGAKVSICARNVSALEKAASELQAAGIEVMTTQTDVTSEVQIPHLICCVLRMR